jgi:hypothetical protein
VNRTQAGQCLDRELAVARQQVAALDQGNAQAAREIDMLEVGRGQRPWRQQRNVRARHVGRRHRGQRIVPAVDEGTEMAHGNGAEGLGQAARQHAAHLERIADARGHLGVVGQDVPAAVALAHQVHGILAEMACRGGAIGHAAGTQEVPVGVHQHRRDELVLEQGLRAVEIGQDAVEQGGALDQPGLDRGPFVGRHHEGQGIEVPAGFAAVVEQVDGRARLLELAARAFHAFAQSAAGQAADDA